MSDAQPNIREMDTALRDHNHLLQVHNQARERTSFCLPQDLSFEDPASTSVSKRRGHLNRMRVKIAAAVCAAIYETEDSQKLEELVSERVHISTDATNPCRYIECKVLVAEKDVRLAMCKLTKNKKVRIFFAWKGTDNPLEWISNMQYQSAETNLAYTSEIKVHGGMLVAWSNSKAAVISALNEVDMKDVIGVEMCGHSRGGGVAAVAHFDMLTKQKSTPPALQDDLENIYKVKDKVSAWLFSALPVFHCVNKDLISELMNEIAPKSVTIMQEFDLVPHLNRPKFLEDAIWSIIQDKDCSEGFLAKNMLAVAAYLAPETIQRLKSIKDDLKDFHHLSRFYVRTVQTDTNPVVWSWMQLHTLERQNVFFDNHVWPFASRRTGKSLPTRLAIADHLALPKGIVADWRSDRCQVRGCSGELCDCNHPDCEMTYCKDCHKEEHSVHEEDNDTKHEEMQKHHLATEQREKLLGHNASDFVSDKDDLVFDVASRSWAGWLLAQGKDCGSAVVMNPAFLLLVLDKSMSMGKKRTEAQAAIADATTKLQTTTEQKLTATADRKAAERHAERVAGLDTDGNVPPFAAEFAEEARSKEQALCDEAEAAQAQLDIAKRTDERLREIHLLDSGILKEELEKFAWSFCSRAVLAAWFRDRSTSQVIADVTVDTAKCGGTVLGRCVGGRVGRGIGSVSKPYIGEQGSAALQYIGEGVGGHIGGSLAAQATRHGIARWVASGQGTKQEQWVQVVKAMERLDFGVGITPQTITIRHVNKACQDLIKKHDQRMVQPQMGALGSDPNNSDLLKSVAAKMLEIEHHQVILTTMIHERDSSEGALAEEMPKILELFHEMQKKQRR